MRHLCDTNVWLAMVLTGHPHNIAAKAWFEGLGAGDTAEFCPATAQSFLRLLTTEAVMKQHVQTNEAAILCYQKVRRDSCVKWLRDSASAEAKWLELAKIPTASPKRWMDAPLAALAMTEQMRFVTFDRAFSSYSGLDVVVL